MVFGVGMNGTRGHLILRKTGSSRQAQLAQSKPLRKGAEFDTDLGTTDSLTHS